jgi:DNA-binding transcriptional MocR family regulator
VYEVGSFSKVLAPALRVGFLLGPKGELFDALLQQVADTGFSASLVVQEMAAYLIERDGLAQVAKVRAEYARRAAAVRGWIERYLGDRLEEMRGGQAGFYYYLTLCGVATHERSPFFRFLSRTTGREDTDGPAGKPLPRVVYLPGQHCVDPSGDLRAVGRRQLRISYGYESMANIEAGLRLMGDACAFAARRRAHHSRM